VSVPDAATALNRGLSRHPVGSTVSRAFQGGDVLDGSLGKSRDYHSGHGCGAVSGLENRDFVGEVSRSSRYRA
jgi:hypothetical protein